MKSDKITNIILIVLTIVLIGIIAFYIIAVKSNNKVVSEADYREDLKANLTYEYITKPEEEQNAQMQEEEQQQNEEMQKRENEQMQEQLNDMLKEFNETKSGVSVSE